MARGQQRGGKAGGGTRTATTNNRTEEDTTSKQNANNTSKGGQRTGQQIRGAKDKMRNNTVITSFVKVISLCFFYESCVPAFVFEQPCSISIVDFFFLEWNLPHTQQVLPLYPGC